MNAVIAKAASTAKPTVVIQVEGDTWTLKSEMTFKMVKMVFKLGVEFDETTADDRKMKVCLCLIFYDDKTMGTHITLKSTGCSCP